MNSVKVIDPKVEYPHSFDFSGIHYFTVPHHSFNPCWIVLVGEEVEKKKIGLFYDEESGYEYEKPYVETVTEVVGMVDLKQSPFNDDEVWLSFFEVAQGFKHQGHSRCLIEALVKVLKDKYEGKVLVRSSPSEEGKMYLFENLSKALDIAGIKYKLSEF